MDIAKLFSPLGILIPAFITSVPATAWAQEAAQKMPEVGKHVASNNLELSSMLLSLLAVLGLIVIAASLLKKFQLTPQLNKDLKVITSLHLGPKERLVVVEVGKQQLLLGVTATNISILQTLEQPLEANQPMPLDLAAGFSKLLKK